MLRKGEKWIHCQRVTQMGIKKELEQDGLELRLLESLLGFICLTITNKYLTEHCNYVWLEKESCEQLVIRSVTVSSFQSSCAWIERHSYKS